MSVRVSMLAVAAAIVVTLLAPATMGQLAPALLVAGFLIGLPHGAVDHLVPSWAGARRGALRTLALLTGYLLTALAAWLALRWCGAVALPVLLLVSILHFGMGDLMADLDVSESVRPGAAAPFLIEAVARGGPVVAGPLLAWPKLTREALAALDPTAATTVFAARQEIAAIVAGCMVASVLAAVVSGRPRAAGEIALLGALFTLVPPLAAFGVYFGAWHGLRHTARLIRTDPGNRTDLDHRRWGPPVRRFLSAAAVPTGAALAAVAALMVLAERHDDLVAPLFSVLLALTVPHVAVVAALDLRTLARASRYPHLDGAVPERKAAQA